MKTKTLAILGTIVALPLALVISSCHDRNRLAAAQEPDADTKVVQNAARMMDEGRQTFRHDTFGSERFFGEQLQLHLAIMGEAFGGLGPGLTPRAALDLGLKLDSAALSNVLIDALRTNRLNLDDPAVTRDLLAAKAVVGITGVFQSGRLDSVGIQCALCHSTVDDRVQPGVGRRLDGWPNRDLDVGKIIALAPNLQPLATLLMVSEDAVRTVLRSWGPGKFDAQLLLDGKTTHPAGHSSATLIPPAFGLAGVNEHTWTGGWGSVTYWNAFVANLEMQGQGTFYDPRLNDPIKYPVAVRAGSFNKRSPEDRVTPKLAALQFYQLAIPAPVPPAGSFSAEAAERGRVLFSGQAGCARCHVPPLFTEPGWNLHAADEIGIDDFQALRSPDNRYRTPPLRGLFTHQKGGYYHDGRFGTLMDVVNHYNRFLSLGLSDPQKGDLVEYLKSL